MVSVRDVRCSLAAPLRSLPCSRSSALSLGIIRFMPCPCLGMILGNTISGISLGLDVLTNGLVQQHAAVEARLALGAHRYTALLPMVRDALRSGFMPTINAIAAMGLVALPGMMTEQILAGSDPVDAVK